VFFPRDNDYNEWKNSISNYAKEKKEFQGKAEAYKKVTFKEMKLNETKYNPVT
jgi:hypothetical protein